MRPAATMLDLVFVVDGTYSTDPVFKALKLQIDDNITEFIDQFGDDCSVKIGVVVYRDPVDRPADKNEYLDLTDSIEEVSTYLDEVRAYGGRDEPEDWAGGLELALEKIHWRDGMKSIFWISDANAHGSRFSLLKRDPHEDQSDRLVALIQEMARRSINFMGVNIRKGGDSGCAQTFSEMEKIYIGTLGDRVGSFETVDFEVNWDPNDDEDEDNFSGEDWPIEVQARFTELCKRMIEKSEESSG